MDLPRLLASLSRRLRMPATFKLPRGALKRRVQRVVAALTHAQASSRTSGDRARQRRVTRRAAFDVRREGPPRTRGMVAPPSVHPNGKVYRWDAGAPPLECSIADLPVSLSATAQSKFRPCRWCALRCPWVHEHSRDGRARGDGEDPSAALLPPTSEVCLGAFRCQHGHCAGRTTRDVLLPFPRGERSHRTSLSRGPAGALSPRAPDQGG